ncbi:MAG: hypothetical protein NTY19_07190 [Planctomycetota bacterium]|nr:hypothetical protein [Planctomycetota bacterium]
MRDHTYSMNSDIQPTPRLARIGLAEFGIDVGTKCSHGCTYCTNNAMRDTHCHESFRQAGEDPFGTEFSIVDPDMASKVSYRAKKSRNRGLVQLCNSSDAWAPEARKHNLGRRCLEALLAEPGWTVRVLTKNAAVAEDFDLILKHRERVLVGLSLTGTPDKEEVLSVVEPLASPLSERFAVLEKARRMGLRTYGMLCPLLPGIADDLFQIDYLVRFLAYCRVEEVFAEGVSPRGHSLKRTSEALRAAGFHAEADAVLGIRSWDQRSRYLNQLLVNLQQSVRRHMWSIDMLKFPLFHFSRYGGEDARIRETDQGVVWL